MDRPTLDEVYIRMLDIFARRSTCNRRQVAAIITDREGKVISIGYNGVPSGWEHCIDKPCNGAGDQPGDTRQCMAIHAEMNAIIQAGSRLKDAYRIYCSCTPCFECAKLIANTKILYVVVSEAYADQRGKEVLEHMGIQVEELNDPDEHVSDEPVGGEA